jgi:serine/threonine protein kinase
MGTVFRARDPQLGRDVAIKTLHPDRVGWGDLATLDRSLREARGRFTAEARAMAAVSHPNVVAIYDAGVADDMVFLAMELVEGQTLRQWLQAERTWREIVDVFLQAARGLAAAHELGFVHRDFKPDNVLVGHDGRVRVTDFGLVTTAGDVASTLTQGALLEESYTQTGMSVGTPAYMAPEQHFGGRVDERSDQFAFCIALFEALHGERPFRAKSSHDLARRKSMGEMSPPRPGRKIPRWLDALVARGLAAEPEDRWSSMHEIIRALQAGLRRRVRTRRVMGKACFVAALATLACTAILDLAPTAHARAISSR